MRFLILRWALTIAAGVACAATFAGFVFFMLALVNGEPLPTTLGMVLDHGQSYNVITPASRTVVGSLVADRATLSVRAPNSGYLLIQGLDILLTGGLWIIVLITLRRLAGTIAVGQPFEKQNIGRLRKVGWAMLALGGWAWIRQILLPLSLLRTIQVAGGRIALLPAISHDLPGMLGARVEARLDVAFPIAGLLILAIAEAFAIGLALREDNEAIL